MPAQVIAASRRAAAAREERSLPPPGEASLLQDPRPWVLSPWMVFAATAAFFSAIVAIYWNASLANFNDARYYVRMAEHPFHFTTSPWGFRILTPILVWMIHVPAVYGFAVVNVLSLATTAALLYLYLLEFYTARIAMFGLALFAISPAVLIELKWVVDVDAFFFAMVMLAFLALARRQWRLLGVALVLGVLDKETMLFVLVPLVVVGYIEHRFEPGKRWVALIGLPVLAYVLLHYTPIVFRPIPGSYGYLTLANLRFVLHEQQQLAGGGAWYSFFWSMVDTFGALWILAILMLRNADRRIRHTAVFLVPVIGSVLLADNWSRVLALGFVVVIPLVCAAGLDRPFAAAVLMLTYDAMVSLGIKNLSGHATYAIEIPLLLAAIGAALVMARPRVALRVLSTAPGERVQATVGARLPAQPLSAATAASNGARQAGATLRSAPARVAAAASVEPSFAGATASSNGVTMPTPSAGSRPSPATARPVAPSRPEPHSIPKVAAASNGSPAGAAARVPAAAAASVAPAPVARGLRIPPPSTPSVPAPTHRVHSASGAPARIESPQPPRPEGAPQPSVEVPAPPVRAAAPVTLRPGPSPAARPPAARPPAARPPAARPPAARPPAPQTPAARPPAARPPAVRPPAARPPAPQTPVPQRPAASQPAPPPKPAASQPRSGRREGGRLRPFRTAPVPAASPGPSRKAQSRRSVAPSRRAGPPPAQPAARAAAQLPARPIQPMPRSEAVVHLETAESLLADVQRLVEAASPRERSAANRR